MILQPWPLFYCFRWAQYSNMALPQFPILLDTSRDGLGSNGTLPGFQSDISELITLFQPLDWKQDNFYCVLIPLVTGGSEIWGGSYSSELYADATEPHYISIYSCSIAGNCIHYSVRLLTWAFPKLRLQVRESHRSSWAESRSPETGPARISRETLQWGNRSQQISGRIVLCQY